MNFEPLFMTQRVMTSLYRTVSTAVLLYYLLRRLQSGAPPRPEHRR